ncbi:MAG: twin-arginine translocase subunit TatC [Deltaproteobacteria bacterium]|nr:twin-arginine translocase subunit TatC [Deltaproteobacteria bacterium]
MPLTSHLAELRSCLIKALAAVLAAFIPSFTYAELIFGALTVPLKSLQIPGLKLIGTAVSEAFFTKMKVAFIASIFLTFPVILWQTWRFIAPGLYEDEKRYARSFVFFGSLFFLLGAWFCYEVMFRVGFRFLLERYQVIEVRPAIRIAEYLSFSSSLLLAFGVVFELPIVAYFLTRIGLMDHRFLIREIRYGVIFIFILAAVLAPPDIVAHVLLSFPLAVLYGVSIGAAYLASRNRS